MNKKIILLFIGLFLNMQSILPMSHSQARIIRKDLYSKYSNNQLNGYQLVESDMSLAEVIDRDLKIMIEHKNCLQIKIDVNKGIFVRSIIPLFSTVVTGCLGGVSLVAGTFALGANDYYNKTLRGDGNLTVQLSDVVVRVGNFCGAYSPKDLGKYQIERYDLLVKDHPELLSVGSMGLVTGGIAVLAGALFIKSFYDTYTFKSKMNMLLKKIQSRWDRDQAVIAKLKEIKQELAGSVNG